MQRRNFLKQASLASTAMMVPSFLTGTSLGKLYKNRAGKILVVVQLSGGNDGLNTIVPYRNDLYYQNRPDLGIAKTEVITVSDELGFNPGLKSLRELFDQGQMSIVNNVGYPNPDRSHFRSMDIWHTASDSTDYLNSGWIGRYLDSNCQGCQSPYQAIEVDDTLSLALKGANRRGFAMSDPGRLKRTADNPILQAISKSARNDVDENKVGYLYKTLIDSESSADYLFAQSKKNHSSAAYPQSEFGQDMRTIAELITADTDTKIYYVSLSGFDTHANQRMRQERLLGQYADAMKVFVQDLKQNGLLDEVLILTFSEFGRRVKQNASKGTDHGTANNLFLMGGKLKKPGFFNEAPDLSQLDEGDLNYTIDFRKVYATILDKWLEAPVPAILGKSFPNLGLI
jgi:uncharacterized protein (DUF1501 family)